jgi:hypothetical protein
VAFPHHPGALANGMHRRYPAGIERRRDLTYDAQKKLRKR